MLRVLDRIHPEIDTVVICTDVALLRYYVQTKLEAYFDVDKNYSVTAETGVLYKKLKYDALVAPLLGNKWLILANIDKVGTDNVASMLKIGNGNSITLLYTEKYINFKRFVNTPEYKAVKSTVLTMYLGKFDYDDIPYLYKDMLQGKGLTKELLGYLCKNYRYDVERVMELFSKMRIGLKIASKQELINEVGLGGVTPASYTVDLLRLFQATGKYSQFNKGAPVTEVRIKNARQKYLNILSDLSRKTSFRTIYNQMYSTLLGILDMKMLIMNGFYRRVTKIIPESFTQQQINRINALARFDIPIREEISLNRVLLLLNLFDTAVETFDYEIKLINIICKYIALWERDESIDDS